MGVTSRDEIQMNEELTLLSAALERSLSDRHGPMMSGEDLRAALGYRSMDAFRQALSRRTVPIPVFSIENRRGKFALVRDVAHWLATQQCAVVHHSGGINLDTSETKGGA